MATERDEFRQQIDLQKASNVVRMKMKPSNDLSLWSIIERLQRRLERQGMSPVVADRALSLALRQLAVAPAKA